MIIPRCGFVEGGRLLLSEVALDRPQKAKSRPLTEEASEESSDSLVDELILRRAPGQSQPAIVAEFRLSNS